jgi:hypothetical protein
VRVTGRPVPAALTEGLVLVTFEDELSPGSPPGTGVPQGPGEGAPEEERAAGPSAPPEDRQAMPQ